MLLLASCGGDESDQPAPRSGPPTVLATTWPLYDLAKYIGGDSVAVSCMLAPGVEADDWQPSREELEAMVGVDLVVANGASLEHWLETANLPRARLVDTSHPFHERFIEIADAVTHSHGGGGEHSHAGTDPYVWLDPEQLALQARELGARLRQLAPAQADAIDRRTGEVVDELQGLAAMLREVPKPEPGDVLLATHPTWGYLARRIGWETVVTHLHGDEGPDAIVAAARETAGEHRVRVVLWERPPDAAVVAALRDALHAPSVVFDPDVVRTDAELGRDTLDLLRADIDALVSALGG